MTAAEQIRDDMIAQDIRYRRADASVRREVDLRLDRLGTEIAQLMIRIDVNGAKRVDSRRRRLAKLEKELRALTRTAFGEINSILKKSMRRIARVETKKVNQIVSENLP